MHASRSLLQAHALRVVVSSARPLDTLEVHVVEEGLHLRQPARKSGVASQLNTTIHTSLLPTSVSLPLFCCVGHVVGCVANECNLE